MTRKLSPYEKTHLHRFGKGDINIAEYGEMPVEYITGQVEFSGQIFTVNKHVLIPRIETEELINLAVKEVSNIKKSQPIIADVGCGSGAIGISLYLKLQKKNIMPEMYLSDISTKAIKVAQENARNIAGNNADIQVFKSDLLTDYPDLKFDLIIANLPYIPSARVEILDDSVKEYEPHLALDGGGNGLELIKKLVKQIKDKLNPGGKLLLEVDYTHDEKFLREKFELDGLTLSTQRDQFERMRFAVIEN